MTINFETKCPWLDWVNVCEKQCKNCECCEGFSPDNTQTYCNYSQLPNCEPEFKKGDYAYRVQYLVSYYTVDKVKVRNSIWVKNHWEYQFGREQHHYPGYKTKKQALMVACEKDAENIKHRLAELKSKMDQCGLSIETVTTKLLESVK